MLRHALFALILVGAAFAGGAAINGPGLAWLQRTFLGGPTIIVDGPSAEPSSRRKPPAQFPTAQASPLVVDLPRSPVPKKPKPAAAVPEADPAPAESPSTPASALALSRPSEPPAAPLDEPPPLATPTRRDPPDLDLGPKSDPVARLASAESPAPPGGPRDWAEIRRRMKALGVARYAIEAELEGRVRFTCVIPVDGLRAIGHHFEADGDDEFQAAEAALKRVALWQATEAR